MAYFEAKIHKIRFRQGLHPKKNAMGTYSALQTPSWISGLLLREGRGEGPLASEGGLYVDKLFPGSPSF